MPPMAAFGEGGFNVLVESLQHDERGGYYVPTSKVFEKLVTRLNRKVDDNRKMIVESRVYGGEENADVLLVAFGSYARVARGGAARRAREEGGLRVRVFVPISIWPLDEEGGLRREASRAGGSVVVMENNLGQLYREVQRIVRDRDVGFLPLLKVELPPTPPTEALRSLRGMVRA